VFVPKVLFFKSRLMVEDWLNLVKSAGANAICKSLCVSNEFHMQWSMSLVPDSSPRYDCKCWDYSWWQVIKTRSKKWNLITSNNIMQNGDPTSFWVLPAAASSQCIYLLKMSRTL
jgi:hypothetical protein